MKMMMLNKGNRVSGRRIFPGLALLAAITISCRPGIAQQIVVEIKEPEGVQEAGECVKCHQKFTPNLVAAFQASSMGSPGIQNPGVYERSRSSALPKRRRKSARLSWL